MTGESYIGKSINIENRIMYHFQDLEKNMHSNKGLQQDYNEGHKFTWEVLKEIKYGGDLDNEERAEIARHNTFYEGFNSTPGGEYDEYKGTWDNYDRLPVSKYKRIQWAECPYCGELIIREFRKCPYCGEEIRKILKVTQKPKNKGKWQKCPSCGRINFDNDKCYFCRNKLKETPNSINKVHETSINITGNSKSEVEEKKIKIPNSPKKQNSKGKREENKIKIPNSPKKQASKTTPAENKPEENVGKSNISNAEPLLDVKNYKDMKKKYKSSKKWFKFSRRIKYNKFVINTLLKRQNYNCAYSGVELNSKNAYLIYRDYDNICTNKKEIHVPSPTPKRPNKTKKLADCENCSNPEKCFSKLVLVHNKYKYKSIKPRIIKNLENQDPASYLSMVIPDMNLESMTKKLKQSSQKEKEYITYHENDFIECDNQKLLEEKFALKEMGKKLEREGEYSDMISFYESLEDNPLFKNDYYPYRRLCIIYNKMKDEDMNSNTAVRFFKKKIYCDDYQLVWFKNRTVKSDHSTDSEIKKIIESYEINRKKYKPIQDIPVPIAERIVDVDGVKLVSSEKYDSRERFFEAGEYGMYLINQEKYIEAIDFYIALLDNKEPFNYTGYRGLKRICKELGIDNL